MRLAIFLATVVIAWLAVVSALWNAGMGQAAAGLPSLLPDDPQVAMAGALSRPDVADEPSKAELSAVRKAARLDPLAVEPRLLLARVRIAEGRGEEATRLLEDARRLNPRSRETRLLLFQQYLHRNWTAGLIKESGALNALMPQGRIWLVALLTKLAENPDSRRETLAALPTHPLQIPVLLKLARDGVPAGDVLKASANLRGSARQGIARPWIVDVVMALVGRGDMPGARQLWSHFYAIEGASRDAAPFDGTFAGLAGPPFGWDARSGPAGMAAIADGALEVEFYGRRPARLARQLIGLGPGDYRLRYEATQAGGGARDGLLWKIVCLEGVNLLQSALDLSPGLPEEARSDMFSVPATGCTAQWLTLEGKPGVDAQAVSATIQSVVIERS